MVGVVVDMTATAPEKTKIREIQKVLDLIPALPAETSGIGTVGGELLFGAGRRSVSRNASPRDRCRPEGQIVLTDAGRTLAEKLKAGTTLTDLDGAETKFWGSSWRKRANSRLRQAAKWGSSQKRCKGCCDAATSKSGRRCRAAKARFKRGGMEKGKDAGAFEAEKGSGFARCWRRNAVRCRCRIAEARAGFTGLIDRMLRDGLLESWEEPVDPVEDPFDTGYTPPAHT